MEDFAVDEGFGVHVRLQRCRIEEQYCIMALNK